VLGYTEQSNINRLITTKNRHKFFFLIAQLAKSKFIKALLLKTDSRIEKLRYHFYSVDAKWFFQRRIATKTLLFLGKKKEQKRVYSMLRFNLTIPKRGLLSDSKTNYRKEMKKRH
jgi:hypothetical protein